MITNLWGLVFWIIITLVLGVLSAGCSDLPPQENYCEIAFAYPVDVELPDDIKKSKIGCACATKDILKGVTTSGWVKQPMEKCRRLRGFSPTQWTDPIDVWFKTNSQTKSIVKQLEKK